jgi:benzodiazapine receptor
MSESNYLKLFISLLFSALAAMIGSLAIIFTGGVDWYQNVLDKPFFAPPSWLFGPAWTVLYFLMALALYLVWVKWPAKEAKMATSLYFAQLCLNVLWSFLFFGQRSALLALVEIIILLTFIAMTTYRFYQVDRRAGYLMVPYLLWVAFATCLNAAIWIMNG